MSKGLAKRTIDGDEYEFTQFGAKESIRILSRVLKLVGEPMTLAYASFKDDPEGTAKSFFDRDFDKMILSKAVGAFAERMDDEAVLDLIETLTAKSNVICNGAKIDFNSHYEQRLGRMFKVLLAALEVQFGNFLEELPGSVGMAPIRNMRATTQVPTT